MARIDLPLGLAGSKNLPRTLQGLKNTFNNQDGQAIARPGITKIKTTVGFARGGFEWNGSLYNISGQSLIKFTDVTTGAFTVIGTIADSDNVRVEIGFNTAVIVVSAAAGKIYTLDKSDTLVDISGNTNFVPCRDLTFINDRFVYIPFDGSVAFFSDVGAAGTVQSASFFDAEELPDDNKAVMNLRNTLVIFGTDSVELFRDLGTDPIPFARIEGARIDNGLVGGVAEYADSLVYIGRKKKQSAGIFGIEDGLAVKLSNERIDVLLQDNYDLDQMEEVLIERINWHGYDILTFKLRQDSFGFYKGEWFDLESITNGDSVPWKAGFITQFENRYYSAFEDNFGRFDEINTDYGDRIERTIDFSFIDPEGRRFAISRAEFGVSQGINTAVGSVALIMSRNNKEFPNPLYRNLGTLGEYNNRLVWQPPGGLGNYIGFAGIRIYTTENVIFDTNSFIIDIHQ